MAQPSGECRGSRNPHHGHNSRQQQHHLPQHTISRSKRRVGSGPALSWGVGWPRNEGSILPCEGSVNAKEY